MLARSIATKEMSDLLGVLAHRHRLRLIIELAQGELDVQTLSEILEIAPSGVSQHLTLLRAHRLVVENRKGRRVFYRLCEPDLAKWIMGGLRFLQHNGSDQSAIQVALDEWAQKESSIENLLVAKGGLES